MPCTGITVHARSASLDTCCHTTGANVDKLRTLRRTRVRTTLISASTKDLDTATCSSTLQTTPYPHANIILKIIIAGRGSKRLQMHATQGPTLRILLLLLTGSYMLNLSSIADASGPSAEWHGTWRRHRDHRSRRLQPSFAGCGLL